jgi:gamma-glutamylcyclotransferase (GGCT)/AIG2-like uncharacterized protein YtfP
MADLFTYGELTRPEVMEKLLGRLPTSRPAVLLDHRRVLDEEVGFFRAIPSRGSRIDGLLYEGLDPGELTKLDVYEEVERGLYQRVAVEVRLGGAPRRAWIYVAPGSASAGPEEG